jgi:V8-like Glu-specific endopeptidase
MTGLSQRFSINEGDDVGLSGTVQPLSSRSGFSDPADDDTAAFPWRVVDYVAGTPLDEPSRIVLQWMGGELHRWHEYQVGDGDRFFIGLVEPELRILTAAEARDLLIASAGWLRPPAELPEGQLRVLEAADILPAETDMPLLQDGGDSFSPQTVLGDDDRVRVLWDDIQQFPWYNVGYQRQVYPNGGAFRCTAFLVTPHVTLTNGHCVFNSERGGYAETVQFAPGQFQGSTGGTVVRPFGGLHAATAWETNPTYTTDPSDHFAHDYAAVFYENGFDQLGIDTYVPLVFNVVPASVQITGYPSTVHEESSLSMWTAVGAAVVRSWDHRILHHQADTSGGNSGGPMWEWVDGQARVVGVHAFGSTNYNGGPRLTDHNLALIQQWMAWTPGSRDVGDTLAMAEVTGIGPGSGAYTHSTSIGIGGHGDKDVDLYRFVAAAGSTVLLSTSLPAGGNPMDTILRLFDASGTQLAVNDDFGGSLYSHVEHTFAASGTYYAGVSGYSNFNYDPNVAGSGVAGSTGDYHLTLQLDSPVGTGTWVGVDFGRADSLSPNHWTLFSGGTVPATLVDLIDEAGNSTAIDLTIERIGDSSLLTDDSVPAPSTLPIHSQSLAGLDGNVWYSASAPIRLTWSDLTPSEIYEVYVFGSDTWDGAQNVTITGAGAPIQFTQQYAANRLFVNAELGDSNRHLSSFAVFVAANASGQIVIDAVPTTEFGGLAGVAIRPSDDDPAERGEIRGFKWHDINGDGVWDAGEPGLEGWEIYLDLNDNGQWDEGEPRTTTGADGSYAFLDLVPGDYTVAEVMQDGWQQTFPSRIPAQDTAGTFGQSNPDWWDEWAVGRQEEPPSDLLPWHVLAGLDSWQRAQCPAQSGSCLGGSGRRPDAAGGRHPWHRRAGRLRRCRSACRDRSFAGRVRFGSRCGRVSGHYPGVCRRRARVAGAPAEPVGGSRAGRRPVRREPAVPDVHNPGTLW